MNALTLFDDLPAFAEPVQAWTLDELFANFHDANPWVYDTLAQMTRDLLAKGQTRVGMKMLFEVLRWNWAMSPKGAMPFKLNNSLASRYARLLMDSEPDLVGVFETRSLA